MILFFNYFNNSVESVREIHKENLLNNPFKETYNLSKKSRREIGLPPNKYFEQIWRLSIDPVEGRPLFEKLSELQDELNSKRNSSFKEMTVPGESVAAKWIERGPNNVGGRTKGIMFDPNDSTDETVFSGGISGGLYKNTKISDPTNSWVKLSSIPENLPVSCITYDPNDTNTFYVGTGESYSFDSGAGNGLWKSTDKGTTWSKVFGGRTAGYGELGHIFINDVIVRNNGGTSEVILAVTAGYDGISWAGVASSTTGMFKSTNGTDFSKINANNASGQPYEVMDLEIAPDNKIWASTTKIAFGPGGAILSSSDASTFVLKHTVSEAKRTEIEIASNGDIYVLSEIKSSANPVKIFKTTDEFSTVSELTLPNDADTRIAANDFTRGQSFYDLMIEVDPNNDQTIFVGGIDIFKSTSGGVSSDPNVNPWTQISHWYGGTFSGKSYQYIHADQHSMTFANNDSTKKLFGNDGGIYFSKTEEDGTETASSRNNNLNTSQIYTIGVAPTEMFKDFDKTIALRDISQLGTTNITIKGMTDVVISGLQDNGSQLIANGNDEITNAGMVSGGDGAASMFSQDLSKPYLITNYVFNQAVDVINLGSNTTQSINRESESKGDFINTQALDSKKGFLYSNYSEGSYQIALFHDWHEFKTPFTPKKEVLSDALLTSNISALTVSPLEKDNSNLYAGLEDGNLIKIVVESPKKQTYTKLTGSEFVGSISDIEFGKTENDIFVTFHNYGVKSIFYSSDGGSTWANKEGDLPDMPVRTILQNPLISNEVIIGTDLGVWYTKNFSESSPTWTQAYNGMSNIRVSDLDMRDDFKVFAASYGGGVFSSEFSSSDPLVYLKAPIPSSLNIKQGKSGSFKVKYLVYGGYDADTSFDISGLPSGTTINYTPSKKFTINKSGEITFELNIPDAAEVKTYPLVISATGGSTISAPVGINLNVQLNDEGPKLNLSSSISSLEVIQGAKKTFKVAYKASGGYDAETTFALTGLPSGVSSTSTPSDPKINISANGEISYELTVGASVEAKTYPLQITATAPSPAPMTNPLDISLKVTLDDLDSDGIKDADDNCPNTANPNQEDFDGDNIGDVCDPNPIPIETFSLKASDETCRSSDNGSVKVTIKGEFSSTFTVAVTGGPTGFTHTPAPITGSDWSLTKLKTGVYKVCLTNEAFPTLKQCYNVSIEEPEDLSVLSSVNRESRKASLNLAGGVKYNIVLNGNLITTYNNNIDLALSAGINTIKVTTNKECQGVYEETIFISENILLSPNPANSTSKLWVGGNDKDINLTLFDITGRVIWTKNDKVPYSRSINVSFSSIKSGLYILKVNSETINKTIKVIRE